VLALLLHEKVRSEAIAIRHEPNGTTLHAAGNEGFSSPPFQRLRERRAAVDPFSDQFLIDDLDGYKRLAELPDAQMNSLIAILAVDALTAHPVRRTELVHRLQSELEVDLRQSWRPDAAWLSGFQKIQLTHLMAELSGAVYRPDDERRKKSELVESLATLFTDAAAGKIEEETLADRVNRWLPANLRERPAAPG